MAQRLAIYLLFLVVASRLLMVPAFPRPAEGNQAAHQGSPCHATPPTDREPGGEDAVRGDHVARERDAAGGCCDVFCAHACHAPAVLSIGFAKGAPVSVASLTCRAPSGYSPPFASSIDHVPLA